MSLRGSIKHALAASEPQKHITNISTALFHLNFYRLHLLYFILVIIVSSVILYGSSTSSFHIAYIDAIYLCTSAMCNIGLASINLSSLTGFQQSILFVLMLMGDLTIVTISVVVIRRYYFSKKIRKLLQESQASRQVAEDIEQRQLVGKERGSEGSRSKHQASKSRDPSPSRRKHLPAHLKGYGAFPAPWNSRRAKGLFGRLTGRKMSDFAGQHHYLSFQPTLDYKGRFTALKPEQEDELGGVEYRALKVLTWLLLGYTALWFFIVMVAMTPYAAHTHAAHIIRTGQPGNLSPAWWSVFVVVSAYSNCGMSLLDKSMIPFADDYLILIFTGTAILAGSALYPVFLRFFIWLLSHCTSRGSELHHSLLFLLHHPRRCYLLLFPSSSTWILFATQVAINLAVWVFWILLGIRHPFPDNPAGQNVIDGLFQAHGLRSAGFSITDISTISPALQFLFVAVMYTSVFPTIMSLRQSNIYEERSLGQTDTSKSISEGSGQSAQLSQVGIHIRNQLAYDIWYLGFCIFLIAIIEHGPLSTQEPGFSLFSLLFEVTSAYGTVGLSLGVPYDSYSFSGAWHVLSKLVLLTVMLRGRHRILPMAIDRAVLLPGQDLMEKLDREYSSAGGAGTGRNWRDVEERIFEEERGEQEDGKKEE